ncbi:hypothetical protein SEA_PABST_6 [Microbacterium phage Pabst]|nr:hypothetical protein SEA_PABST_6 [Microbacterium phage Pabst]
MAKHITTKDCFKREPHEPHIWHDAFECSGMGLDEDGYVRQPALEKLQELSDNDETTPSPGILDGRAAYGDRVQNMKEQAAMINAYLGTPPRAIEAHDVPIIFVLIKAHRLGKMPDYADNYNDIDGYMQIAREVIGDDMIDAATAKEYSQLRAIKNAETSVVEATAVQAWLAEHGVVSDVVTVDHTVKPIHPYVNVERDAERDAMNAHDA